MKVKIGYDFRLKMVLKKVEEGLDEGLCPSLLLSSINREGGGDPIYNRFLPQFIES